MENLEEELKRYFSDVEIKALRYGGNSAGTIEDRFRRVLFLQMSKENALETILERDKSFEKLRKYIDLRKGFTGLDYLETLLLSLNEYNMHYEFCNDIVEKIGKDNSQTDRHINEKINAIMKIKDIKPYEKLYNLKSFEELSDFDNIERKFYETKIAERKEKEEESYKSKLKDAIKERIGLDFVSSNEVQKEFVSNIDNLDDIETLKGILDAINRIDLKNIYATDKKTIEELKQVYLKIMEPANLKIEGKKHHSVIKLLRNTDLEDRQRDDVEKVRNTKEMKYDITRILFQTNDYKKILRMANNRNASMTKRSSLNSMVELLNNINEIEDGETLEKILDKVISLIGTNQLNLFREETSNFIEKLSDEYNKEYTDCLTQYEHLTKEEADKLEGIEIEEINGIKVVHLKGAPFNLIAHAGAIDGEDSRCCASFLSNSRYEMFAGAKKAWVYNEIKAKAIKTISPTDAGFLSGYKQYNGEEKMTPEDLTATYSITNGNCYEYTEIQLATGVNRPTENGGTEEPIKPNAILYLVGEGEKVDIPKDNPQNPKTVYVLHENYYEEKEIEHNQEIEANVDLYINEYIATLDINKLNELLQYAKSDGKKLQLILNRINEKMINGEETKQATKDIRRNIGRIENLMDSNINAKDKLLEQLKTNLESILKQRSELRNFDEKSVMESIESIIRSSKTRKEPHIKNGVLEGARQMYLKSITEEDLIKAKEKIRIARNLEQQEQGDIKKEDDNGNR